MILNFTYPASDLLEIHETLDAAYGLKQTATKGAKLIKHEADYDADREVSPGSNSLAELR